MLNYIIVLKWQIILPVYKTNVNDSLQMNEQHYAWLTKKKTECGAPRKGQGESVPVCLMHDDWEFHFSERR